jgi:hypothetical protein
MLEYRPYIPKTADELVDLLSLIFAKSPIFTDTFFVHRTIDTVFSQLSEGLQNVRPKIGEERYNDLVALAHRMRSHFEADPEDTNGQAREGRKLVREMQAILGHKIE